MELVNELYAFGDTTGLFKPGRRALRTANAPARRTCRRARWLLVARRWRRSCA